MTKEELIDRINDIEWEDFEAKEAKSELPKNIWETVSAFANTSGGWIVLGVKQNGKKFEISGVDNAEKLEQDFLGTLRSQKFNEPVDAKSMLYHIDGHKVLAFHIASSPHKPIYYNNPQNTFIRFGSGDQRATNGEITAMFHNQSFGIKSEQILLDSDLSMLNEDTIRDYRNYFKLYSPRPNLIGNDIADFCKRIGKYDNEADIMSRPVDVSKYTAIYAGAQKNLSMAGVTVIIVKDDMLGKAPRELPTMLDYRTHVEKGSMFNTPPVVPIYTLMENLRWLKANGGVEAADKRAHERAEVLYAEIDRNKLFKGTVEEASRSLMNICFVMNDEYKELEKPFLDFATERGMVGIKGHRSVGGFRASCYNAQTMEGVQALVKAMQDFEAQH